MLSFRRQGNLGKDKPRATIHFRPTSVLRTCTFHNVVTPDRIFVSDCSSVIDPEVIMSDCAIKSTMRLCALRKRPTTAQSLVCQLTTFDRPTEVISLPSRVDRAPLLRFGKGLRSHVNDSPRATSLKSTRAKTNTKTTSSSPEARSNLHVAGSPAEEYIRSNHANIFSEPAAIVLGVCVDTTLFSLMDSRLSFPIKCNAGSRQFLRR
jgi:hypothetical protein